MNSFEELQKTYPEIKFYKDFKTLGDERVKFFKKFDCNKWKLIH